jgi:predicted lactoylglutathione lyase
MIRKLVGADERCRFDPDLTPLVDQAPEAMLLAVSMLQIGNIGVMGSSAAEFSDVGSERIAFGKVSRRVLVAAGASAIEREVDHSAQEGGCREGVLRL